MFFARRIAVLYCREYKYSYKANSNFKVSERCIDIFDVLDSIMASIVRGSLKTVHNTKIMLIY